MNLTFIIAFRAKKKQRKNWRETEIEYISIGCLSSIPNNSICSILCIFYGRKSTTSMQIFTQSTHVYFICYFFLYSFGHLLLLASYVPRNMIMSPFMTNFIREPSSLNEPVFICSFVCSGSFWPIIRIHIHIPIYILATGSSTVASILGWAFPSNRHNSIVRSGGNQFLPQRYWRSIWYDKILTIQIPWQKWQIESIVLNKHYCVPLCCRMNIHSTPRRAKNFV